VISISVTAERSFEEPELMNPLLEKREKRIDANLRPPKRGNSLMMAAGTSRILRYILFAFFVRKKSASLMCAC
jgi:hypothetical protein